MRTGCEVLCVGKVKVMVTPQRGDALGNGSRCLLHTDGAEPNVATRPAALCHRAAWAGYLGADSLGDLALGELRTAGADTSLARVIDGRQTRVYFKDPQAGSAHVLYYRTWSGATTMASDDITGLAEAQPRILHLTGITPALSSGCRDLVDAIIVDRALVDATISFDVNHRPALWKGRGAAAALLSLAQASDIVFVGRDKAEELWGVHTAEEIRYLIDRPSTLVVKDGGIEAASFAKGGVVSVVVPPVDILEPVGAGDAFGAGWLSGMPRDTDARARLRLGHSVASTVLGSVTDASQPLSSSIEMAAAILPDVAETAAAREGIE